MDISTLFSVVQLANALALASLLAILASGLALIFGLRDVMNLAHGALFMLGAYLGHSVAAVSNFWMALFLVPLALAALGLLFEYLVIRPLNKRSHMDVALVTFGFSMIIGHIVVQTWGANAVSVQAPPVLAGSLSLAGSPYPTYRLFLILMGFGVCGALTAWLKLTRSGMYMRAVTQQPLVSRMMGVNTDRLSLLVVCLGTGCAGLAGVLAGPYLAVDPGLGGSILVSCLIVVVIGGLGSLGGAITAALLYGFIQVFGSLHSPTVAIVAPYAMLFAVLLLRPQGFGRGRVA